MAQILALAEGLRQPTSRERHGCATGGSGVAPAEETVRRPNVSRGTRVATSGRHRPRGDGVDDRGEVVQHAAVP